MPTTDDLDYTSNGSGGISVIHPANIGVLPLHGWIMTTRPLYPAPDNGGTCD